jgi:uncharacterized protein YegL/predicted small lipoprotein YifL
MMNMKRSRLLITLLLLISAVLAACGGALPDAEEEAADGIEATTGERDDLSATGSESAGGAAPPPIDEGAKVEVTRVAAAEAVSLSETAVEVVTEADLESSVVIEEMGTAALGESGGRAEMAPATDLTLDQHSRLTAGEVDDNAEWDDYLLYLRNYSGAAVIQVDISQRHQIWVSDSQGNPVLGARIGIEVDGQEVAVLRTHSDGRAYFFASALSSQADAFTIKVTVNDETEQFIIPDGTSQREWYVTHPAADQLSPAARLDVLFLIDATGSMSDEINQLKENIQAIAGQIDQLPSQPNVRFGMVHYRDKDDEYVTRLADFTPDVVQFARQLDAVYADGGGDYPENLNEALSRAVHEPEWRVMETVSLIFLVADAPPHLDYGQQNHYAAESVAAAERGIKIYPIASSGLDAQGEYIFRQMAQLTGGRFIFLTYGPEGPGTEGTETDFQVSDYTVSSLDALVVKIVEEELSYLSR